MIDLQGSEQKNKLNQSIFHEEHEEQMLLLFQILAQKSADNAQPMRKEINNTTLILYFDVMNKISKQNTRCKYN